MLLQKTKPALFLHSPTAWYYCLPSFFLRPSFFLLTHPLVEDESEGRRKNGRGFPESLEECSENRVSKLRRVFSHCVLVTHSLSLSLTLTLTHVYRVAEWQSGRVAERRKVKSLTYRLLENPCDRKVSSLT